jgi:hypothetical protein
MMVILSENQPRNQKNAECICMNILRLQNHPEELHKKSKKLGCVQNTACSSISNNPLADSQDEHF